MNVTLVAGVLSFLCERLLKRHLAIFLSLVGNLFYAVLSELQPSIVRSALMALISFSAQLFGRQQNGLLALFITGFFMLFWDPGLMTSIGFQLSFLSTLGMLLDNPILTSRLKKNDVTESFLTRFFVTDDLIASFSSQLMTLPILLSQFGQVGILSS